MTLFINQFNQTSYSEQYIHRLMKVLRIKAIIKQKQKLYLSAIINLYDRSIVSYVLSNHNNNKLVYDTFDLVMKEYPNAKPIFHSDRGFQYISKQFKLKLDEAGMIQSMFRVGRCIDNGPMEGFSGTLKSELFYGIKWNDKAKLREAINKYINFYNNERFQAKLKGMTPINLEIMPTLIYYL